MKHTTVLTVIAVLSMLIIAGCGGAKETGSSVIKIGFISPMTGDVANLGESSRNAALLAVEEINAAGGIDGKQLALIVEDGRCNGKDATNAANKLINVDKVHYILGGLCSSETLAVAPLAEAAGVVEISHTSSNPDITNSGDYIFRVYPSDSFQGKEAAQIAYDQGARKVATLSCLSDWCVALKDVFSATFKELGGEIVEAQEFEQASTDIRTQLTKVKEASPDLVYMASYTESAVNGLKQAHELGLATDSFLGGDAWDDSTIWEKTKGFSDGARYTIPDAEAPESLKMKFKERFGEEAEAQLGAPQAYDAVHIFAMALKKVGDNPKKVKDYLYTVDGYSGMSGSNIGFDSNGDLKVAKYAIKKVKNGEAMKE
jgi:branched-chain amino acid transport system substrate-binding protein